MTHAPPSPQQLHTLRIISDGTVLFPELCNLRDGLHDQEEQEEPDRQGGGGDGNGTDDYGF